MGAVKNLLSLGLKCHETHQSNNEHQRVECHYAGYAKIVYTNGNDVREHGWSFGKCE